MSNLIPFQFESNEIRTVNDNGEAWVVLADVASAIGHSNPSEFRKLVDEGNLRKVEVSDANGHRQRAWVANEAGLYQALLATTVKKAKPFRMWVTREVLPSIRETGSYGLPTNVSFIKPSREFIAAHKVAALFFSGNQALLSANKTVRRSTGVDFAKELGATHLLAETQDPLLTPTDLGIRLDGQSAKAVNCLLSEKGFQLERRDLHGRKYWELTESGKKHGGVYLDTGKKHGDGTPIRQLKWAASVLGLLHPKAA